MILRQGKSRSSTIRLLHGDFRDWHKALPTKWLGRKLFFAFDPPYNTGKEYGESVNDNLPAPEYAQLIVEASSIIARHGGEAAILLPRTLISAWGHALQAYDIVPQIVVLHKRAKGVRVSGMFNQWHPLLVTTPPIKACSDLWDDIRLPGEGYYYRESRHDHPAPTSALLMSRIVERWVEPGSVVVDLFGGTGSTAVAAQRHKMDCVVVEKERRWLQVTKCRLGKSMRWSTERLKW